MWAGERGPFLLNTLAIKEVWKLWMIVRVSELQTEDQITDRQKQSVKDREQRQDVLPLIQSFLTDEK